MNKKKILTTVLAASLMIVPLVAYAEGETTTSTSGSPITGTAPEANNVANQVSSQTPVTPTTAPTGTTTPAPTSGQTTAPTGNAGESAAPAGQTSGGAKMSYKDVETKLTVVKHNWVNYNTYSQVKKEYQN